MLYLTSIFSQVVGPGKGAVVHLEFHDSGG